MSVDSIIPPAAWAARNPVLVDSVPSYPPGCRYALYTIGTEFGLAGVNPDGQAYPGNVYEDEATARRVLDGYAAAAQALDGSLSRMKRKGV